MRGKDLIPAEVCRQLPGIGTDPQTSLRDTRVHLRLYDSRSSWNWYVVEFDGDHTCFGLIVGRAAAVAGQFSLNELLNLVDEAAAQGESDIFFDAGFEPKTVAELASVHPQLLDILNEPSPRELHEAEGLISLEN